MLRQLCLLDYVLIVSAVAFMAIGAQRGFGKTASGTVGVLISVIVAIVASNGLAPWFTNCMRTVVSSTLKSKLPDWAPSLSKDACNNIAWGVMSTLQDSIFQTLLFTILFLIGIAIWLYASYHFGLSGKFPEAKKANQFFGVICGLLKGVVVLLIVLYILSHLGILSQATIKKSWIIQSVTSLFKPTH